MILPQYNSFRVEASCSYVQRYKNGDFTCIIQESILRCWFHIVILVRGYEQVLLGSTLIVCTMNTHSAAIDKRGPFSRNSAVVQIRAISWLQLAGYLQSYVRRRSFIALVDYHVMNMSHSTKVTLMHRNLYAHRLWPRHDIIPAIRAFPFLPQQAVRPPSWPLESVRSQLTPFTHFNLLLQWGFRPHVM